jgi:NADH-quinone oxidoreductase subunit F
MPQSESAVGRETRIVLENCGHIDPERLDQAVAAGAYEAIRKILTAGTPPAEVIAEVKRSGLRGRGGAGVPPGTKWSFTAPGETKYIVCNADEGEPGTFKDRLILEGDPHRVLEGMMIAGYAVGACRGYVYIRGEYVESIARIRKAIDDARRAGYLGERVLGSAFSFDIEIKKGAGAYICGDETALLESMEGKRGYPRIKPPYPGSVGFWDKPTVVNNVETLANVPPILLRGADAFRSVGTATSPGTKIYLLIGHVRKPGAVEAPMGTSLRALVEDFGGGVRGGKQFKGALLGGAAGTFVSPRALDMTLDFDGPKEHGAVLGSGAILVLDADASIVELLHEVLRFFQHESCGQCVPCRVGSRVLVTLSERIVSGCGTREDLVQLLEVAKMMQAGSLCPLGQSPILPVKTAVETFHEEFEARLTSSCQAKS